MEKKIPQIVLASRSPRRRELLENIGVAAFRTVDAQAEENCPEGLSPEETVKHIAVQKADAAARLCAPEEIVITADTLVFLDGVRLGKPKDEADALRMLTALAGRHHTVCTGVCVRCGARSEVFAVSTEVYFRAATEAELRAYIRTGEPMDKAGAYGIQKRGALLVEKLDGDYFNVVGLPVERLGQALASFGVNLME